MAEELDPQWEIKVSVPMRLPVEMRHELFEAVVSAVSAWEPDERDGWDADVAGCPADEWPDLVELQASHRAWAEEAMRLDTVYGETVKALSEEIAWQKHAYRDGTDKVATGRTIGMEDALRTLTENNAPASLSVSPEEKP
jgi:hypothetical protein